MDTRLNKELECAIETAILAGESVMRVYETDFQVLYKEDESPVTLADEKADKLIRRLLSEHFPEYGILSEENVDQQETFGMKHCFVVDPIDGTREFVKKNGQFGVNIALSRDQEAVLGVIYVPTDRTLYFAARGQGAYRGQVDEQGVLHDIQSIRVSQRTEKIIVTTSHPYLGKSLTRLFADHEESIGSFRYVGSSIKGCLVASGEADVYYRYGHTNEWDTAAMQAIVEEAGGIMRQMDGTPLLYNRKNHLNDKGFYIVNRKENIWI